MPKDGPALHKATVQEIQLELLRRTVSPAEA